MDRSVINKYSDEDKLLLSKIIDKIKFCDSKNKIQITSFLDLRQQKIVINFLKMQKICNYIITGGIKNDDNLERKIILFYPEKLKEIIENIDLNEFVDVISIELPNELKGKYNHKNYLGGLMKLGVDRDKIGDIIVDENGADIIVIPEITKFLINNISELTRFSKSKIESIKLENIRQVEIKTEIIKITIASMRLDNAVAELSHCSRSKANELLNQERVLVNYEVVTKSSKEIKENDIITIRGKGRFTVKEIIGNTRSGRIYLNVEKFI